MLPRLLNLYFKNSDPPDLFDSLGYELPWTAIVIAEPSPLELHALIGNGSCLAYGGN
jgi:hypothetical protein